VIIRRFGRVGRSLHRAARAAAFPTSTALDINQTHVDFVRRFGNKIYYGDASRLDLLRAAGAENAEIFVLAIDDVDASLRTAEPGAHAVSASQNHCAGTQPPARFCADGPQSALHHA